MYVIVLKKGIAWVDGHLLYGTVIATALELPYGRPHVAVQMLSVCGLRCAHKQT